MRVIWWIHNVFAISYSWQPPELFQVAGTELATAVIRAADLGMLSFQMSMLPRLKRHAAGLNQNECKVMSASVLD